MRVPESALLLLFFGENVLKGSRIWGKQDWCCAWSAGWNSRAGNIVGCAVVFVGNGGGGSLWNQPDQSPASSIFVSLQDIFA